MQLQRRREVVHVRIGDDHPVLVLRGRNDDVADPVEVAVADADGLGPVVVLVIGRIGAP